MPRIDRYILGQLLQYFGFFALVIAGVYWVNKAVGLFDQLIGDNQTMLVFLQFTFLTLPQVLKLILPIAAFIATVYGTNRLMNDSELVVMQATGFSPLRLARPVLYFGLIAGLMAAVLGNVLVPRARLALDEARATVAENITAQFLESGVFTHPAKGLTLYIRELSDKGELLDVFLTDARLPNEIMTYTAPRALFLRGPAGPQLIMIEGMAQTLAEGRLAVTRFADFTYDLGAMLTRKTVGPRGVAGLETAELLSADAALAEETGESIASLRFEGHQRLAEPFQALAVALIGFGALMVGGFSRFGLWRQIGLAVGLLVVVQGISTLAAAEGARELGGAALAWTAPAMGLAIGLGLVLWSGRSRRMRQ